VSYDPNRRRKTFSCPGVLDGMGLRAKCIVMGTRLLVTGEDPRLVRLSIVDEPPHMLDGLYVVHFGKEWSEVERKGGLWIWAFGPH
jgi:hypothetical protein